MAKNYQIYQTFPRRKILFRLVLDNLTGSMSFSNQKRSDLNIRKKISIVLSISNLLILKEDMIKKIAKVIMFEYLLHQRRRKFHLDNNLFLKMSLETINHISIEDLSLKISKKTLPTTNNQGKKFLQIKFSSRKKV